MTREYLNFGGGILLRMQQMPWFTQNILKVPLTFVTTALRNVIQLGAGLPAVATELAALTGFEAILVMIIVPVPRRAKRNLTCKKCGYYPLQPAHKKGGIHFFKCPRCKHHTGFSMATELYTQLLKLSKSEKDHCPGEDCS
jgi:phage FluMu protein Com